MGWDPNDKVYTYDDFNSMGEAVHSEGYRLWRYLDLVNEMKMGPQTIKGRFTLKILSPTSYGYTFEMSSTGLLGGSSWTARRPSRSNKSHESDPPFIIIGSISGYLSQSPCVRLCGAPHSYAKAIPCSIS